MATDNSRLEMQKLNERKCLIVIVFYSYRIYETSRKMSPNLGLILLFFKKEIYLTFTCKFVKRKSQQHDQHFIAIHYYII